LRAYLKQSNESLEMQNQCAEIKIRAERRGGELLKEVEREQGKRTDLTSSLPQSVQIPILLSLICIIIYQLKSLLVKGSPAR